MSGEILYYVIVFVFGACIGSFLNVVIWRLPHDEKLTGRSHCPHCEHELGTLDLFPVFSYIFLRGRCRYCKAKISPRYWLIELITASLFVLAGWIFAPVINADYILLLRALFIVAICIVIFVIDLEHFLILNKIIFPAIGMMIIFNVVADLAFSHHLLQWGSFTANGFLAAFAAWLPFWLLWYVSGGKWMGDGDYRLAIFIGLSLGLASTGIALFLAFILGSLIGILLIFLGKKDFSSKIPFGTFLTVGTLVALFWGNALFLWYLGLIAF